MKPLYKKLLCVLLTLCVLFSILPIGVVAAANESVIEAEKATPTFSGDWAETTINKGAGVGTEHGKFTFVQAYQNSNQVASFHLSIAKSGKYEIYAMTKDNPDRAMFQFSLNGKNVGEPVDFYSTNAKGEFREHKIGTVSLTAGNNTLTATLTGRNSANTGACYGAAFDYFRLVYLGEGEETGGDAKIVYQQTFDTMPEELKGNAAWQLVEMKDGHALQGKASSGGSILATFTSAGELKTPYTIVADMVLKENLASSGISAGLTFGKTSDKSYYHYRMDKGTGTHAQLYQWDNGNLIKNLFDSEYDFPVEENVPFRLRVTYDGTTITCYTNGIETYKIDKAVAAGYAGLRIYNAVTWVDNLIIYDGVVAPDHDTPYDFAPPEGKSTILNNEDKTYTESRGTWSEAANLGHDGSATRVAVSATAEFSTYPPKRGRFEVAYFVPANDMASADVTITTLNGMWKYNIPAGTEKGWHKLGTVAATDGTAFTFRISSDGKLYADAVKLTETQNKADNVYTPGEGGSDEVAVLVNQIGYDNGTSKRATVPNAADGTAFKVVNVNTGAEAYTGTVQKNIAEFTELNTTQDTDFYVECEGKKSFVFTIGDDIIQRRSVANALTFMNECRSDVFCVGSNSVGWRDSHQFSFELNGLVLQYMANPALYDSMPYSIVHADTCEYPELRVQDEPDIVWLIQFAAFRYYDWGKNKGMDLHMLTKEQLAYFLYLYPQISEYVPRETYENIRDYTISVWGKNAVSGNAQWYPVKNTNHDLYSVQTSFGGLKGSQPPGHSIVPNLFMYEVAKRDHLGEVVAQKFFDAAYKNCAYTINEIDINDPFYAKGQRMSEYITIPALAYFLEMYPDQAPQGLQAAIQHWADVNIARSNNLWDIRMAVCKDAGDFEYCFHNPRMAGKHLSTEYWTGAAYANADDQASYLAGGAPRNEPGNQGGLQAVTYAAARVLNDETTVKRLKEIGVAAIDDLYGRNPTGRAAFYHFIRDFEGADLGWYMQYKGGAGVLGGHTAVIDANAPERCYPYNPSAYNTGYTEGWVAYNTAWNASLAYAAADSIALDVNKTTGKVGDEVMITLHVPNNLDSTKQETAYVHVTNLVSGETEKITVIENGTSSGEMSCTYQLPDSTGIRVSYGAGLFEKAVEVKITGFEPDPLESITLTPSETHLAVGETIELNAEVKPEDANNPKLVWSSSDTSIATVNNGLVKAVSKGEATITATGWDGTTKGTAKVVVVGVTPKELVITAPEKLSIFGGSEKARITAVKMSDGTVMTEDLPAAAFSTDDTAILRVERDGTITGLTAGEATLRANAVVEGVTVTGSVKISVTAAMEYDLLRLYQKNSYDTNGVTLMVASNTNDDLTETYGSDRLKIKGNAAGNTVNFHFGELVAGTYEVKLYTKYMGGTWAYGTWSMLLNDQKLGNEIKFDNEEKNGKYHHVPLGQVTLTGGETTFSFVSADGGALVPVSVVLTLQLPAVNENVKKVEELIDAIGNVTLESGKQIAAARDAYESLAADEKKLVSNLSTLEKAEKEYDRLVTEKPHPPVYPSKPIEKPAEKPELPFVDVPKYEWYYGSVQMAFEEHLINGMDANHFEPDASLTVAQAIKMAAALHQREKLGNITLVNGENCWYSTYVNYAIANDIIDKAYGDYNQVQMNQPVSRSEFVKILHGAKEEYSQINEVADNAIPDVKLESRNATEIYDFYRAGILTGSDTVGTFYPNSKIKRSEVATILVRMYDVSMRQNITLK